MNNDCLYLAHKKVEQWLREHAHDFESFERSGALRLELLGMDSHRMTQLLPGLGHILGIGLPPFIHPGVFQTPNTLLALLCSAALEHALQVRPEGDEAMPT